MTRLTVDTIIDNGAYYQWNRETILYKYDRRTGAIRVKWQDEWMRIGCTVHVSENVEETIRTWFATHDASLFASSGNAQLARQAHDYAQDQLDFNQREEP